MTTPLTNREIQRTSFVESLSNSLRKQAAEAESESQKFLALASSYVEDGFDPVNEVFQDERFGDLIGPRFPVKPAHRRQVKA